MGAERSLGPHRGEATRALHTAAARFRTNDELPTGKVCPSDTSERKALGDTKGSRPVPRAEVTTRMARAHGGTWQVPEKEVEALQRRGPRSTGAPRSQAGSATERGSRAGPAQRGAHSSAPTAPRPRQSVRRLLGVAVPWLSEAETPADRERGRRSLLSELASPDERPRRTTALRTGRAPRARARGPGTRKGASLVGHVNAAHRTGFTAKVKRGGTRCSARYTGHA